MIKRVLSLLLVFSLLPLIPPAHAAEPSPEDIIAAQYDAYAASIRQKDMDDNAIDQLLEPAIYGKGKSLSFDESDPITAALYGSALFRDWFIEAVSYAVRSMGQQHTSRSLLHGSLSWFSYAYEHGFSENTYNDTPGIDDDVLVCTARTVSPENINATECDTALLLVVGGSSVVLRLNQTDISFDSVTYRVDVHWSDTFDFNNSYKDADTKGYSTAFTKLIAAMGAFLRLKTFAWSSVSGFSVTVPNPCTHSGGGSFYWENIDGELTSLPGDGDSDNPLTKHTRKEETDSIPSYYYSLRDPIELLPTNPWSVEFRCPTAERFFFGPVESYVYQRIFGIYKNSTAVNGIYYDRYKGFNPAAGKETQLTDRHYYYLDYIEHVIGKEGSKVFRIENRIAGDGSNTLWLLIDGQEMGPLSQHLCHTGADNVTAKLEPDDNWFSGTTLSVRYLYNYNQPFYTVLPDWVRIDTAGDMQDSWEIAATCTQEASVEVRCVLCGATRLDITGAPLDHKPQAVPGTEATCQKEGLSDGSVCADCGEILQPQVPVPMAAHTEIPANGFAPTCTEDGLTDGSACSVCAEILKQQLPLPALGHAFAEGICTRCSVPDPDWILPGDANEDGVADYADALLILRSSIGLDTITPKAAAACDMNGDGQLNYSDALIILRRSIGLE